MAAIAHADSELPAVRLRAALGDDCERLWRWRNDPVTRAASLTTEEIPFDRHVVWFEAQLRTPGVSILIIESVPDGEACGQVRFNALTSGDALVSIGLDPRQRGRGIGTAALRAAVLGAQRPTWAERLLAVIRRDNASSRIAFERAGFRGPLATTPASVGTLSDAVGVWALRP